MRAMRKISAVLTALSTLAALILTGCPAAEVSGGSSDRSAATNEAPHTLIFMLCSGSVEHISRYIARSTE